MNLAWKSGKRRRSVVSTVIKVSRVRAPASDCEPKLTLCAMTSGGNSRSARLFSAGTLRCAAQW